MTIKSSSEFKKTDLFFAFYQEIDKKATLHSSHKDFQDWFSGIGDDPSRFEGLKWVPSTNEIPAKTAILHEFKQVRSNSDESFRRAGSSVAKSLKGKSIQTVGIDLTGFELNPSHLEAFTEGLVLGLYQFNRFKKENGKKTDIKTITIYVDIFTGSKPQKHIQSAMTVAESQCWVRDLVNRPANDLSATELAEEAASHANKSGFSCTILKKKEIKALGMGGLLAVNKGSHNEPIFLILEYKHKSFKGKPTVLVGKGVTFDTGGISIKPSAGMGDMKGDMAGAAAVLGTVDAAARLELKTHIIGLVPATDNMPSGTAQCPGDIITTMAGITVEVDNTDAEGRLILADALEYAKRYEPEAIIDLATLTGACVVALGTQAAGIMATDETLSNRLVDAGKATYERVWPLPLFEEYAPQIKSDVADVKNVGGRNAGAITAGKFLQKFVNQNQPWAHIDIAGPSYLDSGDHYLAKGGTGFGVRLLIQYLKDLAG